MKSFKLAVFAYNFIHRKTQDFLVRLFLEGLKPDLIIAADPVKLNIPPSTVKTKIRHQGCIHPKRIAQQFDIAYHVLPHRSPEAVQLVKDHQIDLGIIAGARILQEDMINAFPMGIINFHPGAIPEARGLDALLWSVQQNIPLAVTAHLIDARIDAGKILIKQALNIFPDDTIFDLSERLYEQQIDMIKSAIKAAVCGKGVDVDATQFPYNRKMPEDLEQQTLEMVPAYIKHFANNA